MRIPHRHRDVLVTQELLHGDNVHTFSHEPRSKSVPQVVKAEFADARSPDRCLERRPHRAAPVAILDAKWTLRTRSPLIQRGLPRCTGLN